MTLDEIKQYAEKFFDWTNDNRDSVTYCSSMLFAWHVAKIVEERYWKTIDTAPNDESVLLVDPKLGNLMYCGKLRHGKLNERQQNILAWRCDLSGQFASPSHWMLLPEPPK